VASTSDRRRRIGVSARRPAARAAEKPG
jgi:hypothetical protein